MPFTHSFSPTHWHTAVKFILKKEPGNPTISKLTVIQLLEADMNFAFCLLWGKRLVHHALSHNALSPWNFGGRPGARVHSALLLKTISYNYLRYTCQNAIIFDNDAKACFDRIMPFLGLMATERLGMPQSATKSMLATIIKDDGVMAGVAQIIIGDSLQEECTVDSGARATTKVPWTESIV